MPEASYAAEVVRRDFVQRLRPPLPDYAATSAEGGFNPRQRLPRRYFFRRVITLLCARKREKETARHGGLFFRVRGRQTIDNNSRALRRSIFVRGEIMALGESYEEFVEKFKPKKTTDDCYTPQRVYEAVKDWVVKEYGIDPTKVVRPFYPGGDYERFDYPEDCVVLDNPPFSILAKILRFYHERGVKYFLFAPALTLFSARGVDGCAIAVGATVEYDNGAKISTSFRTNLESDIMRSAPGLHEAIESAVRSAREEKRKELPKYEYPPHVITAARVAYFSKHGVNFRVPQGAGLHIGAMDAQRSAKKAIYGGGYLLSEKAAAEKAAAARWELSERERQIVAELSKGEWGWTE